MFVRPHLAEMLCSPGEPTLQAMGHLDQASGVPLEAAWLWPMFIWRPLAEDARTRVKLGSRVEWNARLVDAGQRGWPAAVSRSATVRIDAPPRGYSRGRLARCSDITAAWGDEGEIGEERVVRVALDADWLNPPFPCVVKGTVNSLYFAVSLADRSPTQGSSLDLIGISEFETFESPPCCPDSLVGIFAQLAVEGVDIG